MALVASSSAWVPRPLDVYKRQGMRTCTDRQPCGLRTLHPGSTARVEYYAYNPRRYAPTLKGRLPLIVFLHGEDGVGPNGTQLTRCV